MLYPSPTPVSLSAFDIAILACLIFASACLYSTVGHAGASAYLAVMALYGLSPQIMKPTALVLNILVATIASAKFYQAGHFSWRLFWPFALGSIPFAFLGGKIQIDATLYKRIVGAVLLFSACRLFFFKESNSAASVKPPDKVIAVFCGVGIGFLSGIVGVGGGIFLSPLVLLLGWAGARTTAAVSAMFILVNSIAGISGHLAAVRSVPAATWIWAGAAIVGGFAGSHVGSRLLERTVILRVLGVVLVIAGVKLIFV